MEPLFSMLTVLAGILLRLGVPILVTTVVILWLHWLDSRWQLEASNQSLLRAQPRPEVPCWDQMDCSEQARVGCPMFGNREIFCWQFFRGEDGRLPEKCLACKVFREAPVLVPA